MSSLLAGLHRPRALFTVLSALTVFATGGTWVYQSVTRLGSGYAFVRGDVVLVGAPIEGQIASVEVKPGQRVKRGDVLARLIDDAIRPEVDRAKANHERSRLGVTAEQRDIGVERMRIIAERRRLQEVVSAAAAEARVASIASRHARRVAARSRMLAAHDFVASADLDAATTQAAAAGAEAIRRHAEARRARAELAALEVAGAQLAAREERVALLQAEVERARADLEAAQGKLAQTVIRAQQDGRITRRILGPGASIRYGDPIVEMWLDGPVAVEAWVDEIELGKVRIGGPVRVSFPGLSRSFVGHVNAVAMVSDEEVRSVSVTIPVGNRLAKSRWVRLHVTLGDPDERLVPGLSAEVTLQQGKAP